MAPPRLYVPPPLFEVVGVPPSWIEICNSISSLVGMVLFSNCLVLVVGLEEKKLESKTWKKMRQTVEP